ncbi:hypothetical protein NDN08_006807 [Rhodosorus marinus]|uniref:Isopropylmalate dehydrogenase-like domain-containing protein n=1 Tax=Rhodosorus marinus TaxID=101924 RepID=A0AAV8UM96_9RHOD|nr:hypothetical protein NDN08_006807 [Rhodosorus marinus]
MIGFVGGLSLGGGLARPGRAGLRSGAGSARCAIAVDKGTKSDPYSIAILKGDGAGPKVAEMTQSVLEALGQYADLYFKFDEVEFGGNGDNLLPKESVEACKASDAVLRAPQGLSRAGENSAHVQLRDEFELFAQLRPVTVYPQLLDLSSFKNDHVEGVDLMLVREVSGGALTGEDIKSLNENADFGETTMHYSRGQVERISNVALQVAEARSGNVVNVDKAYALHVSAFWRNALHAYFAKQTEGRNDIMLSDLFLDDFCREVLFRPKDFDVIVTSNLFGDFIAEILAGLGGPLRVSPSTWISRDGLHVCGPADIYNSTAYPDGTGSPIVNPIAMIRSASMMLRYALDEPAASDIIQKSLMKTLEEYVTPDMVASNGQTVVSAEAFTSNLVSSMEYMHQYEMVCDPTLCGE